MRMLHTMLRVGDLEKSLAFYTGPLGMKLAAAARDFEGGRFTLAFVGYGDESDHTVLELTHNWDTKSYDIGSGYGHVALRRRGRLRDLRAAPRAGREDHARARADEARHDGHRIRRGPGRLRRSS